MIENLIKKKQQIKINIILNKIHRYLQAPLAL